MRNWHNSNANNREPRIFFGRDDNDPPRPDLCKKKCCLKCCKKDKILCIIQLVLLIITIILLMILNCILLIPGFGRRKRRRRSASKQHSLWINNIAGHNFYFNHKPTCDRGSNDIDDMKIIGETARDVRDALSSIVRTRDVSVDLRHKPSKCQTCFQWSVFDSGYEYGPFVGHSAIPKMLLPLIL